jgi:hypothetical protein
VENYEAANLPEPEGSLADVLNYLMQEHGVRQGDLPEICSRGVVSEILKGNKPPGHPQDRMAKRLGLDQKTIHHHLGKMPILANSLNDDLSRGFTVPQVAQKHGWRLSMRTGGIFRIPRQWLKHTRAASSSTTTWRS